MNIRGGDPSAIEQLVPLVYKELHNIAQNSLRHERLGHTLQPTALVNEAYLRLIGQRATNWKNRAHFFAIAAKLMRRILIDYGRRKHAERRGGFQQPIPLDEALAISKGSMSELIALDEALDHLSQIDTQQARIAELHLFAGLSMREIAEVLGCDENVPPREWRMAKAWLHAHLTCRPKPEK